jgi:polyhydroxyalkanoate synthase subunit PhaC
VTSSNTVERSASRLDLIGIAEDFTFVVDPAALLRELLVTAALTLRNPAGIAAANTRFLRGYAAAVRAAAERAVGFETPGPIEVARGDRRFSDPAYRENPAYFLLAQQYLLFSQLVAELVDTAGVSGSREAKARFAANFVVDALAPTNTLPGNPAAIRKVFDTGGKSIVRGLKNMLHDVRHNGGWPAQVDRSGFEVGVNMAATPGSVVYRSDLIELIQYSPQTPETYAVPLLFCPPWINKYYIMDLAPGKSLIEWAVRHGHTCFAISYRNPDKSMSELGFRDYLPGWNAHRDGAGVQRGARRRLDRVRDIPQYPYRLHAARAARCVHGRGDRGQARKADEEKGLSGLVEHGTDVFRVAAE